VRIPTERFYRHLRRAAAAAFDVVVAGPSLALALVRRASMRRAEAIVPGERALEVTSIAASPQVVPFALASLPQAHRTSA